jgi:hypothetical protein
MCVSDAFDDGPDAAASADATVADAAPDDAAADDAPPAVCGLAADATLLFQDEFETDLSRWTQYDVYGACTWSLAAGELRADDACASSFMYAPSTAGLTDYRIVTRMHAYATSNPQGAIEIAWRTTVGATDVERFQYHCNWEPLTGRLLMSVETEGGNQLDIGMVTVALPGTYQLTDWVTMELTVRGADFACRICEIAGAEISAHDPTLTTGSIGLKNRAAAGGYDYVRVYGVP